jgi:Ca2+-binding EF-hand superfamily protein
MKSRILTRSLLALAATAMSVSAMASPTGKPGPEARDARGGWMLQRHDADGDGAITLREYQAAGETLFARLDANGDGRLSAEEMAAAGARWGKENRREGAESRSGQRADKHAERLARMEEHRANRFAAMDANGDGYISRAEFDDARMARFSALDVNGNGVIDADELPTRHAHHKHGKRDRSGSR